MRVSWINTGTVYRRMEGDITNIDTVPVGIYEIGVNMSGWFLTKIADKFTFNHKVYNINDDFIDYVEKTYDNTTGNIGILLNGLQGSGKTVDAKCIANRLNLPIIIVKSMGEDNDSLMSYLSSFNFDCVLFFDEFEKQFAENDPFILQIMDGVYNSLFRRVFLLTTNKLDINENLLSRPSRIRYILEYKNLDKSVVEMYLNDNLKNIDDKDQLIDYIDTLTISTIDILKSVVEEVNIHGVEEFLKQKHTFNVNTASYVYRTTYAKISIINYQRCNYTIDAFLKDVDIYENYYKYEDLYNAKKKAATSQEEIDRLDKEFEKLVNFRSTLYNRTVETDKPYYKLIVNKDSFDNEPVVAVYEDKHVITTIEGGYICYYFIHNHDEKPSLYSPKVNVDRFEL